MSTTVSTSTQNLNYERPQVQLDNQNWASPDGVGFTVDHLASIGEDVVASAIKLSGCYAYLEPDPYDRAQARTRAMLTGYLFLDDTNVRITYSDSDIHQQSENTEYPNKARVLPGVPIRDAFLGEIANLVKAAFHSCQPDVEVAKQGLHFKAHLIRLQPTVEQPANATPPRPHKDNACWVFVALLARENVTGGENILYNNKKQPLAEFTLSPLQYFALDDRRHYHHVEQVTLEKGASFGYRDALVIEINTLEPTKY